MYTAIILVKFLDSDLTIRERIVKILESSDSPLTVYDLAVYLGIDRKQAKSLYSELEHVARSIRRRSRGSKFLAMYPPECRSCGYVFKDLKKIKEPSKCPRCRSERISPPRFAIIED